MLVEKRSRTGVRRASQTGSATRSRFFEVPLSDERIRVDQVEFFHRRSKPVKIIDRGLTARPTFKPPASGPAFDCGRASKTVEQMICSDAGLAAQDLALSRLYDEMRLGYGTEYARRQLQQLQRQWLQQRDRDCTSATDGPACLATRYAAQLSVLRHWVPATPSRDHRR